MIDAYESQNFDQYLKQAFHHAVVEAERFNPERDYSWDDENVEFLADDIIEEESGMVGRWLRDVLQRFDPDQNWIIWPNRDSGLGPDYRSYSGI